MKFISSHNPPEYIQRILTEFSHRGYWVISDYQDKDDDVVILINDQRYLHDTEFKLNHKVWFVLDQHINEQLLDSKTIVKISKVLVLSNEQQKYLKQHPLFQSFDALVICPGIDPYVLPSLRECLEPRDPKRIIWTNDPKKGLAKAIQIFKDLNDPDSTMEVCCDINSDALLAYKKLAAGHNIIFTEYANRIEGYLKANVWFNPILCDELFPERCIEAQAMGAIPVSTRFSSNETYMRYGFSLNVTNNRISDPVNSLRSVLNNGIDQTKRFETIEGARNQYNYYRTVDRLESYIVGTTQVKNLYQYSFQLRWAEDPLINIGCNVDAPQLGDRPGAVNVDVVAFDKHLNQPTAAHIVADARSLPDNLYGKFACAILGDILEHMTDDDAIKCLIEAKKCVVDDGHIIVTCPEDYSYVNGLHGPPKQADPEYIEGVASFHKDPVTCDRIKLWAEKAGLNILRWDVMGYYNSKGHGLLFSKNPEQDESKHIYDSKPLNLPKGCDIQYVVNLLNQTNHTETESNILLNAIYRSAHINGMTCEIGVREGHSTFLILDTLRNSGKRKTHIAVDPYGHLDYFSGSTDTTIFISKEDYTNKMKNSMLRYLYEYCDKYDIECLFFPLEDYEFFSRYSDGIPTYNDHKNMSNTYSLVLLDGPHCYSFVKNEFEYFKDRMAPGGFIVFDDINRYGHMKSLDEYVQSCGFKLIEHGKIKASYVKM